MIGAGLALVLGPLIDRFGAKRMLVLTISLVGAHALMIAQTQQLWQDTTYVRVMLSIWVLMVPVVMVCVIALAMAVCKGGNSATQFAIYMSAANLGHSAGSKVFGMVADSTSYDQTYKMLAMLVVVMVIVLFFHHQSRESREEKRRKSSSSLHRGDFRQWWWCFLVRRHALPQMPGGHGTGGLRGH